MEASVLKPQGVQCERWTWTSMRPGLIRAGSTPSLWLLVSTMILSSPLLDHSPSIRFNNPDSVTYQISVRSNDKKDLAGTD